MRKYYDNDFINKLSSVIATNKKRENPNCNYEQSECLNEAKQLALISDLITKMQSDGFECDSYDSIKQRATWTIANLQPELIPNINEYIDGSKLSKITINGISIEDVMNQYSPDKKIHFMQAVQCMIYWKKSGYRQIDFYKEFFAIR